MKKMLVTPSAVWDIAREGESKKDPRIEDQSSALCLDRPQVEMIYNLGLKSKCIPGSIANLPNFVVDLVGEDVPKELFKLIDADEDGYETYGIWADYRTDEHGDTTCRFGVYVDNEGTEGYPRICEFCIFYDNDEPEDRFKVFPIKVCRMGHIYDSDSLQEIACYLTAIWNGVQNLFTVKEDIF